MAISAKDVKALRDRTNAPMMECKAALEEAGGDIDAAIKVLRERGIAKQAKRADRDTAEGVIRVQVGEGMKGGTAIALACETDFSANSEDFQRLADLALAAASSLSESSATVEAVMETAVEGKAFSEHLDEVANKIRENMKLSKVVRYEGICGSYLHFNGKSASLVELAGVDAETEEIAELARGLCMHVVASNPAPVALDEAGIPQELLDQEKEIFLTQAKESGKPAEIAEKMVVGRMKKFVAERALLEQEYARDPDRKVSQVVADAAKSMGKDLSIARFARLTFGE